MPTENAANKYLLLIMLDSVAKVKKKYYPERLLEECKYETKKTNMENLFNGELEASLPDDESDSKPDNDSNDETGSGNNKDNNEPNE